ncbi:cation diffusion facilitator transporter [Adhaeribacter aerolatus]|uniref:Cation diffusion facilitator transporter n=1 Tax=Adhaeribacter aerolatus TaxID=670289 RepID=A0A512B0F4_9BACT|nr:cation diffusion facilitator family transporter [Adhaeribacter aerolatus]GEO05450.1 cation diffusion facilitator transporter [Adhaeribacter aerolatus]
MSDLNNSSEKGLKTTFIGILFSAFLAIIKALGGIFGNSYALIADAIESTADIFTSGMLWLGLKWAAKPADKNHPYGHGKVEALVAIGIALALCAAAMLIATESIHNIQSPHKVPASWTLIILVVVILTKELLYRFVLKTGLEINSGAVKADAFHHRSDAITSAAAFIGITIGIIGGKGYEVADDWAALLASGIILINAYLIIRPAIGELLDEDLDPELTKKVANITQQVAGVLKVEKCHTRKMGVMNHADIHIWVDQNISIADGHQIAHKVKTKIQAQLPQFIDVMIHVEPTEEKRYL